MLGLFGKFRMVIVLYEGKENKKVISYSSVMIKCVFDFDGCVMNGNIMVWKWLYVMVINVFVVIKLNIIILGLSSLYIVFFIS